MVMMTSYHRIGDSVLVQLTNRSSSDNATTQQQLDRIRDVKRKAAGINVEEKSASFRQTNSNTMFVNPQKYREELLQKREKTQDTKLELKKLKYHFKNISSKIIQSKTSRAARQVVGQARREVLRLKREKQNKNYESEEIDAAITHAKAMERIARKKVKHLEEEELAETVNRKRWMEEADGISKSETEDIFRPDNDQVEDSQQKLEGEYVKKMSQTWNGESVGNIQQIWEREATNAFRKEWSEEELQYAEDESALLADMFGQFSEEMKELMEESGLEDFAELLIVPEKDMAPEDLKMMKMKHRNKEMKEIVKADADYMKVSFEHLEKAEPSIDVTL